MTVLIDADVCVHAVCNQAERSNPEGEPIENVLHSLKMQIRKWITDAGGDLEDWNTFQVHLSGPSETNFRYKVDPEYKGKRPPKPRYFNEARQYLLGNWRALEAKGEADDALAAALWLNYKQAKHDAQYWGEPVQDWCFDTLVSVDKDLDMVPGWHYNPRNEEKYFIDEYKGWYNFFYQMLVGDTVDNIQGLYGVGPKTAEKLLDIKSYSDESVHDYAVNLYTAVILVYAEHQVKGKFQAKYTDIFQAADLLWMVRDDRRGHQVLLDLMPGHISKAMFDEARREVRNESDKGSKCESEGEKVPAVDSDPFD